MEESVKEKSYYTRDYFFDIMGSRFLNSDVVCDSKHGNLELWHVEHNSDPDIIETNMEYLEIPMIDLNWTEERYNEYNDLLNLAWKYKTWYKSTVEYIQQPLMDLNLDVAKKLKECEKN